MSVLIPVDRVRTLVHVLGEVRECLRAGEDDFSNVGQGFCRLVGADVVAVVFGWPAAHERAKARDMKSFGLSQSDAAHARRVYLVEREQLANIAVAKVLALSSGNGDVAVKRRSELVDDDAWYRSDFVDVARRA
jgi:hypothetical protein